MLVANVALVKLLPVDVAITEILLVARAELEGAKDVTGAEEEARDDCNTDEDYRDCQRRLFKT